jgi:hypothetical protein
MGFKNEFRKITGIQRLEFAHDQRTIFFLITNSCIKKNCSKNWPSGDSPVTVKLCYQYLCQVPILDQGRVKLFFKMQVIQKRSEYGFS